MSKQQKELGTIISAEPSAIEDHGCLVQWVQIEYDEGGSQGFGGIILSPEQAKDYVKELCKTFNVKSIKKLKGKRAYALRSFDEFDGTIEGLVSIETGKAFLINVWRKKHYPETKSVLEQKKEIIKARIESAKRNIFSWEEDLNRLDRSYIDWENIYG